MYCYEKKTLKSIIQFCNIIRNAQAGRQAEYAANNQLIDSDWILLDSQVKATPLTSTGQRDDYFFIIDALYLNPNRELCMVEIKSSMTAPLTKNQRKGYPQTTKYGAIIENPVNNMSQKIPAGTPTYGMRGD